MALYFLRHGQSAANLAGIFSPPSAKLTHLGREQAVEAAEKLQGYDITKIVCSGLERSWETACIVADILGFDRGTIIRDSRLNEYNMGSLTGQSSAGVTTNQLINASAAEKPQDFQERVLAAIVEYSRLSGNTLVISHAGVGCVLEAARLGVAPAKFYDIKEYDNCSIHELRTGS